MRRPNPIWPSGAGSDEEHGPSQTFHFDLGRIVPCFEPAEVENLHRFEAGQRTAWASRSSCARGDALLPRRLSASELRRLGVEGAPPHLDGISILRQAA